MSKSKNSGKFRQWVAKKGGPKGLAPKLETSAATIFGWLSRYTSPSTATAVKLVRMGQGAFSHDDIVRDTFQFDTKKRLSRAKRLKLALIARRKQKKSSTKRVSARA